jgi:hypothetical protein
MQNLMRKLALALLALAAACNNSDNLIVGGVGAGSTTPDVVFDNIGSAIHGVATLRDAQGNPASDPLAVILMSDRPNLCDILKQHPDYFRNAPESYEALIMVVPHGYLGTFIVGRGGTDAVTSAEIVAASGPQPTTPFHALTNSYVAVTEWTDAPGEAVGSFNIQTDDPYGTGLAHQFFGRFKTTFCPTLEGTLLP